MPLLIEIAGLRMLRHTKRPIRLPLEERTAIDELMASELSLPCISQAQLALPADFSRPDVRRVIRSTRKGPSK